MKLSNRKVLLIVLLITFAMAGLVFLQTILLKTALKAEEESFRSNVILAINKTAADISNKEARQAIFQVFIDDSANINGRTIINRKAVVNQGEVDTLMYYWLDNKFELVGNDTNAISFRHDIKHKVSSGNSNIRIVDSVWEQGGLAIHITDTCSDSSLADEFSGYAYSMSTSDDSIRVEGNFLRNDSARIMLIEAALSQLDKKEIVSLEERIDMAMLDSTLNHYLNESDIKLDYDFGVTTFLDDSLLLNSREDAYDQLIKSPYRARLFPFDMLSHGNYLLVHFPDKPFYIYSKLGLLIIPTGLFLIIIISCFIYTIRTMVRQRRTAENLNDFINNMTHEFKTPISTIHLAAEAIEKNEAVTGDNKIAQYNSMILSENLRMRKHVDKILQIATLEEGDYILKFSSVDLHKIIVDAVDASAMQIKLVNGKIETKLTAGSSEVMGDAVHLLNIIHNLLDNAVKYTPTDPMIIISTENDDSYLIIRIRDNGIGLHADDLKNVFDKYYRVSHGDVHNVKGFGLGLSYVKMITEAHKGEVSLASSLGKGCEVTLKLPLK